MTEPTFDKDGYPSLKSLAHLGRYENWHDKPVGEWIDFAAELWNMQYGDIRDGVACEGSRRVDFITGGWSGNESVIKAMSRCVLLWNMVWQSSHRGGLHVFEWSEK